MNLSKTGYRTGVPKWPPVTDSKLADIMHIDVNAKIIPETAIVHQRYMLLDELNGK